MWVTYFGEQEAAWVAPSEAKAPPPPTVHPTGPYWTRACYQGRGLEGGHHKAGAQQTMFLPLPFTHPKIHSLGGGGHPCSVSLESRPESTSALSPPPPIWMASYPALPSLSRLAWLGLAQRHACHTPAGVSSSSVRRSTAATIGIGIAERLG